MGVNSRDVELNLEGNDHTDKATRSAGNNLDRLRRKMGRFNSDTKKSMLKSGSDSATAFFHSFLRGLTFGKIGATVDSKMGPQFARMGIRLGGVFAVGLVGAVLAQAGNLILAGLPLILGPALLALPILGIMKKQIAKGEELKKVATKIQALEEKIHKSKGKSRREAERELGVLQRQRRNLERQTAHWEGLKRKAKSFLDQISAPLQPTVFRLMDRAGRLLDKFGPKFRKMVKGLAPGFEGLVGGVMDGVVAFVTALTPAIPGINAGMKEWGKQAPKIGKGIGDAIAAILKDPKKVQDAVRNTADLLRGAADSAIDLANALVVISQKYKTLSDKVDKFEQSTGGKGGPLGGMLNAVKRNAPKITGAIRHLGTSIHSVWNAAGHKISARTKIIVSAVVRWLKGLPGKAKAAVRQLWPSMKSHFDEVVRGGKQRAKEARDGVARFLRRIPAAAGRAVSGLWGAMKGAFQTALDGVQRFADKIAAAVARIAGLKAKASGNPGGSGGGSKSWSSDMAWAASSIGSGFRTGGPTEVSVAAPSVDVRMFLDSREIRAIVRTEIREANKGDAYRARIGRR
jgi:hypothetical protein